MTSEMLGSKVDRLSWRIVEEDCMFSTWIRLSQ